MKKITLVALGLFLFVASAKTQILKDIKNKVKETVSVGSSSLTEDQVASGLKEALTKGIETGVAQLSKPDGYFKDLSIALGQTNRISLTLAVWIPIVAIALYCSIGILQINEK